MNTESTENTEEALETDTGDQAVDNAQAEAQEPVNPLSLSDEEIMAMDAPPDTDGESDEPSEPEPAEKPKAGTTDADASDDAGDDGQSEKEATEPDSEENSDGQEPERDIAAEHAKLFAPLKAGGQTIEVKSVEEIISLMQKGADYHRKTEELSAHRKTIKTLEKAGIKAENLDYLIELHNKDPQAIAKLIADSGVDPFEVDTDSEETKNYKPKQHSVSNEDLALDEMLDTLSTTPTYNQLIDVVGNKWDDQSRQIAASNPQTLKTLNSHMADGIYDLAQTELTRQKALGNLQGLTDLAAYQQVVQAIDAQGGFNHLITDERRAQWAREAGIQPTAPVAVRPKQGSSDPNLDAKRRAAAPTKAASKAVKKTSNQRNPLSLSDDEFEKQFSSTLQ